MSVSMATGKGMAEAEAIEKTTATIVPSEYVHKCGATTKVARHVALSMAADPAFYSDLYCAGKNAVAADSGCAGGYFPVSEFTWTDPAKNGSGYSIQREEK